MTRFFDCFCERRTIACAWPLLAVLLLLGMIFAGLMRYAEWRLFQSLSDSAGAEFAAAIVEVTDSTTAAAPATCETPAALFEALKKLAPDAAMAAENEHERFVATLNAIPPQTAYPAGDALMVFTSRYKASPYVAAIQSGCVLWKGPLSPGTLEKVRAMMERERPKV